MKSLSDIVKEVKKLNDEDLRELHFITKEFMMERKKEEEKARARRKKGA